MIFFAVVFVQKNHKFGFNQIRIQPTKQENIDLFCLLLSQLSFEEDRLYISNILRNKLWNLGGYSFIQIIIIIISIFPFEFAGEMTFSEIEDSTDLHTMIL